MFNCVCDGDMVGIGIGHTGAGVTDNYELPKLGTENQTWVLWKNSMCSFLQATSPAPVVHIANRFFFHVYSSQHSWLFVLLVLHINWHWKQQQKLSLNIWAQVLLFALPPRAGSIGCVTRPSSNLGSKYTFSFSLSLSLFFLYIGSPYIALTDLELVTLLSLPLFWSILESECSMVNLC